MNFHTKILKYCLQPNTTIFDPYIEIIQCQYKNKEFISKKHKGIMLCILEQTLAYLFDSRDLNHSIMFKYYGKSKNDIRIGYLNITSFYL